MTTDDAAHGLALYLERRGEYAAEVIWDAALAIIGRAIADVDGFGHWHNYPRGSLRRLRAGVVEGLELARLAANLQDAVNERDRDVAADAREHHAAAGTRRRRDQTMPAELARLANAAARRAATEDERTRHTNFHLEADYPRDG